MRQIAIVYLTVGSVSLTVYICATIFVYTGEKELERCVAGAQNSMRSRKPDSAAAMEAGTLSNNVSAQIGIKTKQTNTGIDEQNTEPRVRTTRSAEREHDDWTRQYTMHPERTKQQLLY